MSIFGLPHELSRVILASAAARARPNADLYVLDAQQHWHWNEQTEPDTCMLNRYSLVGPSWHEALAPPSGVCIPALTRCVKLSEPDLLVVAQIINSWWRRVTLDDITDAGMLNFPARQTSPILTLPWMVAVWALQPQGWRVLPLDARRLSR